MGSVWRVRNLIGFSCLLVFTTAASCAQVRGAEPAVSSIALTSFPARGATYELGEEVRVRVEFDRTVIATGSPRVALSIGTETRQATFVGSATRSLYFYYIVQAADRDENGISIAANALILNGGTITAADGTTDADLTHGAVGAKRRSNVDGSRIAPPRVRRVALVSSPARGDTYAAEEKVEVAVEFDRAVTATGSPQVALTIGTETRHATLSGWSRKSLYFYYIVQVADRDENGISIAANALALTGGTITAADGTTDADLTHTAVAARGRSKVDGSLVAPPKVTYISLVSSPARGDTYELGEEVSVIVEFDRAVTAAGSPQVGLTVGTQTRHAEYSGWGRQSLVFSYTVQASDRDEDGVSIAANALILNGGTVAAAEGAAAADLTHEAVGAEPGSKVNGSLVGPPPRVQDISFVSSPAEGDTYGLGETVKLGVEFTRAVTATGSPQLALNIGTQTRYATFSGWGRESLFFSYTVQKEDVDGDGISIATNAFLLDGGTIKAAASTIDADLTHEALAAQPGSKVNGSLTTRPGVQHVALTSFPEGGDTYGLGETVRVIVAFDRAVTATGRPQVALNVGTQTRYATFSGWSRESLYFRYTVQEEDVDEDGISIAANALDLNGGTIAATVGTTDVDLTHRAVVSEPHSKVNGSLVAPPRVRDIRFFSSPARGDTYAQGETIQVGVEFDRTVTVSGTPRVALTIGAQTRRAAYSGSWEEYVHLSYTVQEDDRDEDGISIPANSLSLGRASITAIDGTTDAQLSHRAVSAEPARKVNGSQVAP